MLIEQRLMNRVIGFLNREYDLTFDNFNDEYTPIKITDEMVEQSDGDLEGLEGYTFECIEVDGTHKHDGQNVEYTFMATSPEGKTTFFSTEMNLVCGWNFCEDIELE